MEHEIKLVIEIKNTKPVELADFAIGMSSIGGEYGRFLGSGEHAARPDDVKLYIKEVRAGSIITELVAGAMPHAIPFVEHAGTVLDYAKHLSSLFGWLAGRLPKPAAPVGKASLEAMASIIEPVAKDSGAQLNINAINASGNAVVNITMSSLEANAIQNAVHRELRALREPVPGLHQQVVMYWAQARNSTDGTAGDKARVESIFLGDVKVIFASDVLKAKMFHEVAYPFTKAYLVDLIAETIDGRPVRYKVTELHEVFERD